MQAEVFKYFQYDRETMLDPSAVFGMLFGSEFFEEYVGELALAALSSIEVEGDSTNMEGQRQKIQEKMGVEDTL